MGLLKQAVSKSYVEWDSGRQFLGRHLSGGMGGLYAHYTDDLYENGYSSIRAIANRFMIIRPHAIDANGEPLENKNIVNALARPNRQFSGLEFRDQLAVFYMVKPKTYVLVHQRVGSASVPAKPGVKEDQISGFTILEDVEEINEGGKLSYKVYQNGTPEVYYPYQVMTFFGVNPNDLGKGYSPAYAARRWSSIDDYIADYQNGFFRNGAVPAGQFIITAATVTEFNNEVDNLKEKHRGADKNNNIMYVHRPVDTNDGKPVTAKIEWVPFNTPNKDMALDKIFDQANKKIDSVYGVSAFIRAIDEAPNFATAQVIERNFVENTVRPFTLKIWTRFSHEMNRITNGMDYGLAFELETPGIAEENKLEAETDQIRANTITMLVEKGYTLESAINAMKLPDNWKLLETGTSTETDIDNDKPEVDEGGEVNSAPEQPLDKSAKSKKKRSKKVDGDKACLCCDGYGEHITGFECYGCDASGLKSEFTGSVPCDGREDSSEVWIDSNGQYRHAEEKAIARKSITDRQRTTYESKVEKAATAAMKRQIEQAITDTKAIGDPTEADIEKLVDDIYDDIIKLMVISGNAQTKEGVAVLQNFGINTATIQAFVVGEIARNAYRDYLRGVAFSYSTDTADSIRRVLQDANANGLTRAELEKNLRGILVTDKYRITRLAVTEVNTASSKAGVMAMENIQGQANVRINKIWTHFGPDAPCEFCAEWIGTKINVTEDFIGKGSIVTGRDGGTMINNWRNIDSGDIHPNGHCGETYEVEIVQ